MDQVGSAVVDIRVVHRLGAISDRLGSAAAIFRRPGSEQTPWPFNAAVASAKDKLDAPA